MRTKERDSCKTIIMDMYADTSPCWGVSRNGVRWMQRRLAVGQHYYNLELGITVLTVQGSGQSTSGTIVQPISIGADAPHTFQVHIFNHAGNYVDSLHRLLCTVMDRRL